MRWRPPAGEPAPDPALTRAFAAGLPGGWLAGPLLAFPSVASTQTVCRALADGGAPEGTVVLADHQSAGRGRLGRTWASMPGSSLLFSCLLRPPLPLARWPELTILAGCAVAEGVERMCGLRPRLRWPNDVLADGRKLAGILAEGVVTARPLVVLGIGINVCQTRADWSSELRTRAVSLRMLGATVSREAVFGAVLSRLAARYDNLLREGFGPVREAWRARAALGEPVWTPAGPGVAEDLAPSGALWVRYTDGTRAALVAGATPAGEPAAPGGG